MAKFAKVAKLSMTIAGGVLLTMSGVTGALSLDFDTGLKIDGLGKTTLKGIPSASFAPQVSRPYTGLPMQPNRGLSLQWAPTPLAEDELHQLRVQEKQELDWFAGSLIAIGTRGFSEDDVEEASTTAPDLLSDGLDHIEHLNAIRKRIRELGKVPQPVPVYRPAVGNDSSYGVGISERPVHPEAQSDPTSPPAEPAPDLTVPRSIFHDELMRQGFPDRGQNDGSFDGNDRDLFQR
jgi:hypothetical protein